MDLRLKSISMMSNDSYQAYLADIKNVDNILRVTFHYNEHYQICCLEVFDHDIYYDRHYNKRKNIYYLSKDFKEKYFDSNYQFKKEFEEDIKNIISKEKLEKFIEKKERAKKSAKKSYAKRYVIKHIQNAFKYLDESGLSENDLLKMVELEVSNRILEKVL